jgi:rubredoxin
VYDAAKDGGGKAFADLPDTWVCPICGAPKSSYKPTVIHTVVGDKVVWVHEH